MKRKTTAGISKKKNQCLQKLVRFDYFSNQKKYRKAMKNERSTSSKEPPPSPVDTRTDVRSKHVTRTVHGCMLHAP